MQNNSSKSTLFLMELILAILFFSISGAVCIQLFVQCHVISQNSVDLNHGVLWAQNTAETFYGCNGSVDSMIRVLPPAVLTRQDENAHMEWFFDSLFQPLSAEEASGKTAYSMSADIQPKDRLKECRIRVITAEEKEIYSLLVSLSPKKEVLP